MPYDKGNEFCVMKMKIYDKSLQEILNCSQFTELKNSTANLILKVKKDINNTLFKMKEQEQEVMKFIQNPKLPELSPLGYTICPEGIRVNYHSVRFYLFLAVVIMI